MTETLKTAGALLDATLRHAMASPVLGLAMFVLLTAMGIGSDMISGNEAAPGLMILTSIVTLVVGFYVLRDSLERAGLMPDGRGGSMIGLFVMGFVSGLAILIGFVLLIVPGLYLSGKWAGAAALLIAEDEGGIDSLRLAGKRSAGMVWSNMLAVVAVWLPAVAVLAGFMLLLWDSPEEPWGLTLLLNAAISVANLGSWYLAVAVYAASRTPDQTLDEVFA